MAIIRLDFALFPHEQRAFWSYRARYYDPKIGRFISEDPIGWAGGIDLYAYVLNKPATWSDPFGLKAIRAPGQAPCQIDPCISRCLQKVMGTPPNVTITPNSGGAIGLLGYAASWPDAISLPGSCKEFFSRPFWVLHEYHHITQHWARGQISFFVSYVTGPDPWDADANAYAKRMKPIMQTCLDSCLC